jgi:hypothetical protein
MYDDRGQMFQQVVHDKNNDGSVLSVTYESMTVSVEPPGQ